MEDDVALLAVRAHPVRGERPPRAGPEVLPRWSAAPPDPRPPSQPRAAAARTASAIAVTPRSAHRIE